MKGTQEEQQEQSWMLAADLCPVKALVYMKLEHAERHCTARKQTQQDGLQHHQGR